jgi:hypothetical protein
VNRLYNIFYQSHIGSWAILVLLFFVGYFLLKAGKAKGAKIVHMVLRLFYIIMLVSGIGMLVTLGFPLMYLVKGALAFFLIYAMEMILVRTKKGTLGEQATLYWAIMIVTLVLVVLLGYGVISF